MITFLNEGSKTTDRSTAIRMPGNDSEMSASRISSESTQPPKNPARRPMRLPVATVAIGAEEVAGLRALEADRRREPVAERAPDRRVRRQHRGQERAQDERG